MAHLSIGIALGLVITLPVFAQSTDDAIQSLRDRLKSLEANPTSDSIAEQATESVSTVTRRAPRQLPIHRSAVTESQEDSRVEPSPSPVESRLSKNWSGSRSKLSGRGVDLGIMYKGELNRNTSGGARQGQGYLGNLDLRLNLDFEKLARWRGGSLFLYGNVNHGKDPSSYVGDIQQTSNIQAPVDTFRLYEAYLQQIAYNERMSFLIGLHDLNSEFYVTESSGIFLNYSFGVGRELAQSGVNGPSVFPFSAPAVRLRLEPSSSFYAMTGVFNGQAGKVGMPYGTQVSLSSKDGALLITEAGLLAGREERGGLPGKYGLGLWTYTTTFNHQTRGEKVGQNGLYFLADQSFTQMISVFFRYGRAASGALRFDSGLQTGIVLKGIIPSRYQDRLGFGFTMAQNGDEYMDLQAAAARTVNRSEQTFELTYRAEIFPGLALQPDFQWVIHPNTDASLDPAKVLALRFELSI